MSIGSGREHRLRGLSYILQKFDNNEPVAAKDIFIFMKDLKLPPMRPQRVYKEMQAAGGSLIPFTNVLAFSKLPQFVLFIKNNLKTNLSEKAMEGFIRFKENPIASLQAKRRWHDVGNINTLTVEELRTIVQEFGHEGGGLSDEDFQLVMESIDLNADGEVNYKKLVEKMQDL